MTLSTAEADLLRARSLPVLQRDDGSPALRQACPALRGRCCAVYGERPANCRAFECHLYKAVDEGEVDEPEALRVVAQTHEAIGRVADALGLTERLSGVMDRARRHIAQNQPRRGEVDAAWNDAEALLDRHFRGRRRR